MEEEMSGMGTADIERIKENVHQSTDGMEKEVVVEELVKSTQMVGHLTAQINELRRKNIELRLNEEDIRKESELMENRLERELEKLRMRESRDSKPKREAVASQGVEGSQEDKPEFQVSVKEVHDEEDLQDETLQNMNSELERLTIKCQKIEAERADEVRDY